MYTRTNYKAKDPGQTFRHSKSTDNFYCMATERSLKFQSTLPATETECLACKHEHQKPALRTSRSPMGFRNIYLNGQSSREEYYKTNEKDQLEHLRKTKRYLEQLLERSKNDFKKISEAYEKRLAQLSEELAEKSKALVEMQLQQNRKEAENCYLANASLVRSYKQMQLQDEDLDQNRARKLKQLARKTTQLEEQLSDARQANEDKRLKIEALEVRLSKMDELEFYAREYEAMKLLIAKMEEEKLQLLDRQHAQVEHLQERHRNEMEDQRSRHQELKQQLEDKMFRLTDAQRQLHQLRHNFTEHKNEQYETLRELLEEREKECHSLESRLNCIEAELNFVRGRYGYLLRLAQTGQLADSFAGEPDEFCIERVGRFNISNGKQSLMSMNLSPIRRR